MSNETTSREAAEAAVAKALTDAKRVIVTAHVDPDGDAIGSALAMTLALREAGKETRYVQSGPVTSMLGFFPSFDEIRRAPDGLDLDADVLLSLDCASGPRLGPELQPALERFHVVNVDHHVSNPGFGDVNLIDPESAATGEIAHRLLARMGIPLSADVATCLYAAIVTDTGRFGYPGTRSSTHETAAELLRAGVAPADVHGPLYREYPESFLRLNAMLTIDMKTRRDGRIAWVELTHAVCEEAGLVMDDAPDMVDLPVSMAGVEIAALFRETRRPGETKVSLRSKGPLPVNGIMIAHGGGGHPPAAGCTMKASVEESREVILAEVEALLDDAD